MEQWLIYWDGFTAKEATWEDAGKIRRLFPALNLEDKVEFDGRGIVVNQQSMEQADNPIEQVDNPIEQVNDPDPDPNGPRRSTRLKIPSRRLTGYELNAMSALPAEWN